MQLDVKTTRLELGMTQKQFAVLAEVDERTVQRWESGKIEKISDLVYYRLKGTLLTLEHLDDR